jgi:hypothetical protein
LASIKPTDVWALVRQLTEHLAPSTARHVHGLLSMILRAAVEDGYLAGYAAARNRVSVKNELGTPTSPVVQQCRSLPPRLQGQPVVVTSPAMSPPSNSQLCTMYS